VFIGIELMVWDKSVFGAGLFYFDEKWLQCYFIRLYPSDSHFVDYLFSIEKGKYTSYIQKGTAMPMLYMEDAIDATIKLMEAPSENISVRTSYNLGGMSFTPEELAEEIKKIIPDFEISYEPDFRQKIAESWPKSIDDSVAKRDWGLNYKFGIKEMSEDMIKNLSIKLKK